MNIYFADDLRMRRTRRHAAFRMLAARKPRLFRLFKIFTGKEA